MVSGVGFAVFALDKGCITAGVISLGVSPLAPDSPYHVRRQKTGKIHRFELAAAAVD
jgi:hypothetical protein